MSNYNYDQKLKWLWGLREQAAVNMTPPSYNDLIELFEELEKAWETLSRIKR